MGLLCLLFGGIGTTAWRVRYAVQRAARLSYLQGNVICRSHADSTGNEAAQLNMPLIEGLRLTTGEDGQAEMEFEDGSLVRLTPNSSLSLDHSERGSGAATIRRNWV